MLSEFLRELQRRRVVRVALAYLVVGWLIIQVTATTFPILDLPAWTLRLVLVLVILGFPVALALSWAFDLTDTGIERTPPRAASHVEAAWTYARLGKPGRPPFLAGRTRYVVAGTVLLVAVLSVAGWFAMGAQRADAEALDEGLVAVLPFRVTGADPSLAYLREGMVDLVSMQLAGSWRAVDPRTTMAAFRNAVQDGDPTIDVARDMATRLRAGSLLLGSIVGSGSQVTITASLVRTRDGREVMGQPVTGRADSIQVLVERVIAGLVSLEAGEGEMRLDLLTGTSLPALRAYLQGNALLRRGEYVQAVEQYHRALELDSTFVLAALQLPDAASMTFNVPAAVTDRAVRVIDAQRHRLTPADRAFADARWPPTQARSVAEQILRWESAGRLQPDRPEVWYHLGDIYFHEGALLGEPDYLERAAAAFERARSLDPDYFLPLQHLVWIADLKGDTAFAAPHMERYLATDPEGISAVEFRLRLARLRGDTASHARQMAGMGKWSSDILIGTILTAQVDPTFDGGLADAFRAADVLASRAASESDRSLAALHRYQVAMNAGRPAAGVAALRQVVPPAGDPQRLDQHLVYAALYWDGDTALARTAYERLNDRLARRTPGSMMSVADANATCAVQSWRLWNGVTRNAASAIEELASSGPGRVADEVCAAKLRALLAHHTPDPGARQTLAALDSLLRTGPRAPITREQANLTAARLHEAAGDYERALNATTRMLFNMNGQYYRSTFLELTGRYAAALNQTERARAAWTRYLGMRADAEAGTADRVDRVRRELAALRGDSR